MFNEMPDMALSVVQPFAKKNFPLLWPLLTSARSVRHLGFVMLNASGIFNAPQSVILVSGRPGGSPDSA